MEIRAIQPTEIEGARSLLLQEDGWRPRFEDAEEFRRLISKSQRALVAVEGGAVVGLIAILSMSLMVASCSRRKELEESSAYQAACQGPPLRTVELREKAMVDGYNIDGRYDCIDKASFVAVNEARARWEAANTPEAIAQREAERAEKIAEEQALRTATAKSQGVDDTPSIPPSGVVLRSVDVNTAAESELANAVGVGPVVAAQILDERKKGRFNDWADLVNRVIGLHSARNAVLASVGGLTVDGQSLPGAPPDAAMADRKPF